MNPIPLIDLPWWALILVALLLTHVTIISVTLYLHRHQTHRALDLHPAVAHFFRFWLWLTTGMVTREWVAIHRKHHARVETEEDPHSPQILGISRVLWGGILLYRRASEDADSIRQYGHGTPDDWLERHVYAKHPATGIMLMLVADIVLFGVLEGALIWGVQMIWIPFWAAGVINGIGHWLGYRNYETGDASRNIIPWGIIIGGEELHNNHHAYASSARFATRRFELDIGWLYLRGLERCGLARIHRTIPLLDLDPRKAHCDMDTVNAVVANRFQVMADFFNHVVKRVYREELAALRGSPKRGLVKRTVARLNRSMNDTTAVPQSLVEETLAVCPRLRFVLTMKTALQDTWNSAQGSPEQLMIRLEEWCIQAENSGIQVLRDFSARLRGYTLSHPVS
jgi:stearoyl-CoA desaturase (Delta-9 desaturase)